MRECSWKADVERVEDVERAEYERDGELGLWIWNLKMLYDKGGDLKFENVTVSMREAGN